MRGKRRLRDEKVGGSYRIGLSDGSLGHSLREVRRGLDRGHGGRPELMFMIVVIAVIVSKRRC